MELAGTQCTRVPLELTRDLVAKSQVYPQGCKSGMLGPAQNTCLWDIQTA